MRNRNMLTYIIAGLFIIGLISSFKNNISSLLIPIIVFGVIYLLYKDPLGWFKQQKGRRRKQAPYYFKTAPQPQRKRKTNLRVIQGNKKEDNDNPPPYH